MTMLNSRSEVCVDHRAAVSRDDVKSRSWRRVSGLHQSPEIVVARWTDTRMEPRRATVAAPEGCFVLDIALAPTRVRLISDRKLIFDGSMASGMTYVCHPAHTLRAEYSSPADFLRLYVADSLIDPRTPDANLTGAADTSFATMLSRDALIDHLARALQAADEGASERYIESLARAIVARTAQIRPKNARVSPLPQWRLAQVIGYIEANISEAISLADLAAAAELSRAHFSVQFRLATGCRPHDFILLRRIEAAKRLLVETPSELAEVALAVGFQTQAHFSTVFKRFVGDTPGGWRRLRLGEGAERRNGTFIPVKSTASLVRWVAEPA
jgi:AraC family transcriptional regulator